MQAQLKTVTAIDPPPATRPRVLLADDHILLLEAFARLLADKCDVVGAVSDGRALITEAARLKPDVIVVDVSMPVLNGIDAARQLRATVPDSKVVVLTMNEDPETAADAFRAGVSAYVIKRSAASELMIAIREVMQHHSYVTPLVTKSLMQWILGGRGADCGAPTLTERQREVIQLVADGRSMKDIARALGITPRTVAFHKYRMMSQLKVRSTAELVRFAITHRLI